MSVLSLVLTPASANSPTSFSPRFRHDFHSQPFDSKSATTMLERLLKFEGKIRLPNGKFGTNKYRILQNDLIRGTKQGDFISEPIGNIPDGDIG